MSEVSGAAAIWTIPVTVVVATKNEERGISKCLTALRAFDQVIVFDSNSEDATREIVKAFGYEVVNYRWNGQYPKKKQAMLEWQGIRNDWVLELDADERPTQKLLQFLCSNDFAIRSKKAVAFDLGLEYSFEGRRLRFGHKVFKRSLVRRGKVRFLPVEDLDAPGIGEVEGHYQPVAEGAVDRMPKGLIHEDEDPIRTWFDRHNRYSDWEAHLAVNRMAANSVNRLRSRNGRLFRQLPAKPLVFFVYDYFVRGGFLDGRAGYDYALSLAWYYWLTERKIVERRRTQNGISFE